MAEYHEVRIVAELRKQGEHERAEGDLGAPRSISATHPASG